jgi:hypothetical protein
MEQAPDKLFTEYLADCCGRSGGTIPANLLTQGGSGGFLVIICLFGLFCLFARILSGTLRKQTFNVLVGEQVLLSDPGKPSTSKT